MINLATPAEHLAGAAYVVHSGNKSYPANSIDEAWQVIGDLPFCAGYTVTSESHNCDEFIPY